MGRACGNDTERQTPLLFEVIKVLLSTFLFLSGRGGLLNICVTRVWTNSGIVFRRRFTCRVYSGGRVFLWTLLGIIVNMEFSKGKGKGLFRCFSMGNGVMQFALKLNDTKDLPIIQGSLK